MEAIGDTSGEGIEAVKINGKRVSEIKMEENLKKVIKALKSGQYIPENLIEELRKVVNEWD